MVKRLYWRGDMLAKAMEAKGYSNPSLASAVRDSLEGRKCSATLVSSWIHGREPRGYETLQLLVKLLQLGEPRHLFSTSPARTPAATRSR